MARSNRIAQTWFYTVVACLVLPSLLACGGGASAPANPSNQQFSGVALTPSTLSTVRGNESSSTLTTAVSGGFNNPITLTASGAPAGVTVTFDPETIPASGSSTITVTVGSGTPTGTYVITVTATAGGIQKTTVLSLMVTTEVLLTWNASTSNDVVGYNVARSTTAGGGYARLNTSLISGTSYVDETAQSGQTYYYVATAVDSQGAESVPSNEAVAEVP